MTTRAEDAKPSELGGSSTSNGQESNRAVVVQAPPVVHKQALMGDDDGEDGCCSTPETGDEAEDGTLSDKIGDRSIIEGEPGDTLYLPLNATINDASFVFSADSDHPWQQSSEEIVFTADTNSSDRSGDRSDDGDDGRRIIFPQHDSVLIQRNRTTMNDDDGGISPNTTRLPSRIPEEGDDNSSSEEDPYADDSLLWKLRLKCGKMINNDWVQISVISLIIINAIMMGIATLDFVTDNPDVDAVFTQVDRVFLVIFTVEVVMQLFYLSITLFSDGWLVFDLLIVIFSWSFESLQIVRAFRVFRAFRLITRVKPLRDLVMAIGAVLPRMYAIGALLLLIFYIFSVLFTELFSELPLEPNYFKSLDASLFTCMEMMTLEWGEIAREVMVYKPWAWLPFSAFIAITGFIVFNLIVAVVCDAVAVTEKTVREMDGLDTEDPGKKLADAQERIDLLQCHITDMLRTQTQVQEMIEALGQDFLRLDAERVKAENREAELRIRTERKVKYTEEMDSSQDASLNRSFVEEKQRKKERRRKEDERVAEMKAEELLNSSMSSLGTQVEPKRRRRPADRMGSLRNMLVRDLSVKTIANNRRSSRLSARSRSRTPPRDRLSRQGSSSMLGSFAFSIEEQEKEDLDESAGSPS